MSNEIIIISILGIVIIFLGGWILFLEIRLRRFFKGEDGKNLEKVLTALIRSLQNLEKGAKISENHLENIEQRLQKCVQNPKVVRFNPFSDVGGAQSFTIALLDEKKNGLVISSLYGREINRIYAKPVLKGDSEYQLSKEEKEAVNL